VSRAAQKTAARTAAEEALLDAAERLLIDVGYAGITTRSSRRRRASTTA
jgi:AcrR family transcriptional regulator